MHVAFVCFHCYDFVVMSISDALNLLFYGIIDVSSQQLLAIFRHKDDVYFETISFFYTGLGFESFVLWHQSISHLKAP